MKIIRDGKEIELTREELVDAYYEQEHIWDMEYISGNLVEQYNDVHEYDEVEEALQDNTFCDRVAYRYRKYLDDQSSSEIEFGCLIDAYNYAYAKRN